MTKLMHGRSTKEGMKGWDEVTSSTQRKFVTHHTGVVDETLLVARTEIKRLNQRFSN